MARAGHASRVVVRVDSESAKGAGLLMDSVIMTDNLATIHYSEIDPLSAGYKQMSLNEFIAAQNTNAETFGQAPHFASLVPLVDRMYDTAGKLASPRHSPTLLKLMMICRREFFVAASQIRRGLPFDSH